MCLIVVGPLPEQEILENAEIENPDGTGIVWYSEKGFVEYKKDLSVKDLLALPDYIKRDCIVHFRWQTAGGGSSELIHPFPVSRDVPLQKEGVAKAVLLHNGHLYDWEKTWKKLSRKKRFKLSGPMSDSRMLAHLAWRFGHDSMSMLDGQRVAIVTSKGAKLYGDWVRDGERYYSNSSYKSPSFGFRGYGIGRSVSMREWYDDGTFYTDGLEYRLDSGKWVRVDEAYDRSKAVAKLMENNQRLRELRGECEVEVEIDDDEDVEWPSMDKAILPEADRVEIERLRGKYTLMGGDDTQ